MAHQRAANERQKQRLHSLILNRYLSKTEDTDLDRYIKFTPMLTENCSPQNSMALWYKYSMPGRFDNITELEGPWVKQKHVMLW